MSHARPTIEEMREQFPAGESRAWFERWLAGNNTEVWQAGRDYIQQGNYNKVVTTEAELATYPFGAEFVDGAGATWSFGRTDWDNARRVRHFAALVQRLPLRVRFEPEINPHSAAGETGGGQR